MARKAPCQYCKQRRRKCERTSETEPCKRCAKMKKKCIAQDFVFQGESSEEDDSGEDPANQVVLASLYVQIRELEQQLKSMELEKKRIQQQQEPCWELEFSNGRLHLKSKIETLEELLLYGQSAIRYLSPFGTTFQGRSLAFKRNNNSFVKTAIQVASKYKLVDYRADSSAKAISKRFSTGVEAFMDPKGLIQRLIDNYFSCFNDTIPILHQPSFMLHLRTLNNPMDDAVVLAICAASAISGCRHAILNSNEKRYFGEFFYDLCIKKLIDMFDDPDKALESVLVINLLQIFMLTTLRLNESYKWASIALILSKNLKAENPGYDHHEPDMPRMKRIKNALVHRNSVLAECASVLIEFVINNKRKEIRTVDEPFDILPDETQKTKDILEMMNFVKKLAIQPSFIIMADQARLLAAGDIAKLSFEEIIRYEETIVNWWHDLPENLKMCKEPSDISTEIIQKETDIRRILLASYVQILTLNIHGCLVQPLNKGNIDHVYEVIRDRAIHFTMHAAEMCLQLTKRVDQINTYCYSPTKLLVRSIDSVMSLLQVEDEALIVAAKKKLAEYMEVLSERVPRDHQVSSVASPYSVLSAAPPGSIPTVTELYKNYPLPGEALVYDIVRTIVDQNTSQAPSFKPL